MTYTDIKAAVDRYEALGVSMPVAVTSSDGEWGILGYSGDGGIELRTLQSNDWIRINTYYPDGTTTETFER